MPEKHPKIVNACVHIGDVIPIQVPEKIVAMVGMLVGVTVFACDSDSPGLWRIGLFPDCFQSRIQNVHASGKPSHWYTSSSPRYSGTS